MLNTLTLLADGIGSNAGNFDVQALTRIPHSVGITSSTPGEPSTLVLALLGAGMVVAFASVERWLPRRDRYVPTTVVARQPVKSGRSRKDDA